MKRSAIVAPVVLAILCTVLLSGHPASAETAYFIVANPGLMLLGLSDSYVLPLSDPGDIAIARQLAQGGFLIVVATISTEPDGINRDMLAPGQPEWSWHVKEFHAFADAAIELCDGNPTMTNASAQAAGPGHEWDICYWSYTVVDEIMVPTPVESSTWGNIKALYSE